MKFGTLARLNSVADADRVFGALRENGLETCQLVYKPAVYLPEEARQIRAKADAYGITISAQFLGFRDSFTSWDIYYGYATDGITAPSFRAERMEYLLSAFPFVQALGISDFIIHAGLVENNPFQPEYGAFVAAIRLLAKSAANYGLNLLFETGAESPITLLRVIEDVGCDNLFINLDTGNLILYGYGNPVDAVYTFGKYVRGMHAKDALPPTNPRKFGEEVAIGSGFVDFKKVLRMLHAVGFEGPITLEREISGPQQQKDIEAGRAYLEAIWQEVLQGK